MDVYEAVRSRRSVRAFDGRAVPREALCRVLAAAAWAPSGSNMQPWHVYVVTGERLAELKRLALRAEGLHSCPQMAWSVYRKTVAKVLSPPEGFILFCGVSIGYEDETVNHAPTGRAPLEETVTFLA